MKRKLGLAQLVGLGLANGILVGGALATSHASYYLPVAVGVGAFITFTFVFMSRCRSAKQ